MTDISDTVKRAVDRGMDGSKWDLRVPLARAFPINAYLGWEDVRNTHICVWILGPERPAHSHPARHSCRGNGPWAPGGRRFRRLHTSDGPNGPLFS